jgi:hypothetical protein
LGVEHKTERSYVVRELKRENFELTPVREVKTGRELIPLVKKSGRLGYLFGEKPPDIFRNISGVIAVSVTNAEPVYAVGIVTESPERFFNRDPGVEDQSFVRGLEEETITRGARGDYF